MSAKSSLTLAFALALLAGSVALAQEQPVKPPKDGKEGGREGKGGNRIKMGDDSTPADGEKPAPDGPKAAGKTEPELLVEQLASWPSQEARQAAIRLRAQPSIAYPLLERRMLEKNQEWRMIAGVAATLGMIGDLRCVDLLRAKLEDNKMFQHSAELLDALVRVDPVGAKSRLLALMTHPASAVVLEVEKRLEPRVAPTDVDALRDVYDAGGATARATALRLMTKADRAATRADVVKALRDKEPDVCIAAAASLASDDSKEALELTQRTLTSPIDRQFAYGVLSLAMRSERGGVRSLDDSGVRTMLGGRGIKSLDRLCRATAAVLLADEGYFHEVEPLDEALDRDVLPVLIDSWVSREYWPDMKTVQPIVLRRLVRLTGRLDLDTPPEWAAWWEQEGSKFRAHRVLVDIPADAVASMVVTVEAPGGSDAETTTIVAAPEQLVSRMPDDLTLLVPAADAQALAAKIAASGLLQAADVTSPAPGAPNSTAVSVRIGRRERRVILRTDTPDAGPAALLEFIGTLRSRYAWQRYRTTDNATDAQSFVVANAPSFAPDRTPEQRSAALAALIVGAIDDRRGSAFNVRALAELEQIAQLPAVLGAAETDRLLSNLGRRKSLDPVAAGIVRVLAKARRPEATPLLLEFLAANGTPEARDLATIVLHNAPREQFLKALDDARSEIRLAAYAAADAQNIGDDGAARILKAVDDKDRAVAGEAVRALGRMRVEKTRPILEALAAPGSDLRAAAVEALGALGGRDSLATIMTAYASDDVGVRIAAIRGLAAAREPEGLSAIVFAMSSDPSNLVREMASRAVVDMGTDRAAAELRKLAIDPAQAPGPRRNAIAGLALLRGRDAAPDLVRLVDDPSDEVADEAALALARFRDPAAVQRLIAMLDKERSVQRARQGLESISLESFAQRDPAMVADFYKGWWDLSKDRGPKRWLLDALALDGAEDPNLRAWAEGKAAREAVPALVAALRNERWYVRRAADLGLRELMGRSVGDQDPWTTPGDVTRMAEAWEKICAASLSK